MLGKVWTVKVSDRAPRIIETVSNILGLICCGLVIIMTFIIVYDVAMRQFFDAPTIWADELSCYLLVGVTFLGAPYTLTVGGHVRVETVVDRLNAKTQRYVEIATDVLSLAFLALYSWHIIMLVIVSYQNDRITQSLLRTRVFLPQILMAVGIVWLTLQLLSLLLTSYRKSPQIHKEARKSPSDTIDSPRGC